MKSRRVPQLIAVVVLAAGISATATAVTPPLAAALAPGETLATQFRNPPNEYRILQYGLTKQTLEKYPRYGIGGFMAWKTRPWPHRGRM